MQNSKYSKILFQSFFLSLASILLPASFSSAADITWTGNTSTDWAEGSNWSLGSAPLSSDNVTILDASTTDNNPSISEGAVCNDLTIAASGILNGNGQTINVYGNWTNSGTFSHGNGTIIFRGSVDTTFIPGSSNYYNIELNKTGYDDLYISGTATVLVNVTQTDGDFGQGQINLSGNYIIGSASNGGTSYYLSTVINFNGTGDQSIVYNSGGTGAQIRVEKSSGTLTISDDIVICGWSYTSGIVVGYDMHTLIFGDDNTGTFTPGGLTYNNLQLNKPGGYSELQFSGTAMVAGNFTHTDGELASGQMNLSGNYIIGAAAGGGSSYYNATIVNLNGTGDQTITYTAGGIGGHVRIDKASGVLTVPVDITVNSWTYVQGTVSGFSGGTLTFGDDNQGTFIPGTLAYNNITINVGSIYRNLTFGSGTFSFNNLTVTGGKLYLSTNNPTISLSGNMSIGASGTVYAGTGTITVYGDWTNTGTFNHGNGTIAFRGSTDKTFTPGSSQYYDIEINKTSAANVILSETANVARNLIHTDGELRSGQINVGGDYVIGASAEGVHCGYQAVGTVVNLNHATNDQQIVYSAGGIGARVRIDKASGTLTISDNITVTGWTYVQGTVMGLDTHRLILGDNYHGEFTPGSLVYSSIELNKTYPGGYNQLSINGTATVTGDFISTDGEVDDGQIDLGGNYIIGPLSEGEIGGYGATRTYINFNNATEDQQIVYSIGGIGATIRVDKAGGSLIISDNINVSGWVYVQGNVVGLDTYDLVMRDNGHGVFTPGSMTYGNVIIDRYGPRIIMNLRSVPVRQISEEIF